MRVPPVARIPRVMFRRAMRVCVDSHLYGQEGFGHGHFFPFPGTPDSNSAYDVI